MTSGWRQALRLNRLARSGRTILIGPWRSEAGFEVLYWLPWLQAWRSRFKIDRNRLVVVSRGGAGAWYDAALSVDLYHHLPVDRVRKAMLRDAASTGSVKQHRVLDWEQRVLALIADDLGVRRYHVLHPSLMYRALTPWWEGHMGLNELLPCLQFTPLTVPPPPLTLVLPERFVVADFYARHTWPLTEDLVDWTQGVLTQISRQIPVVVLQSSLHADEHLAFPCQGEQITIVDPALLGPPAESLSIQAAVIARAQAFVGTYGGMMQLAVRLGKPAAGFYTAFTGTAYAHKHLTEWLGVQQKTPVFIGRPEDARVLKEILT